MAGAVGSLQTPNSHQEAPQYGLGGYSRISIPEATKAASTPVAPVFGTTWCRSVFDVLEVGQEVVVWLHGDDPPVLSPDLLEQREQQLAPLGGLGLKVPEAGELVEQRFGALDGGLAGGPWRWSSSSRAWRRMMYWALVRSPRT